MFRKPVLMLVLALAMAAFAVPTATATTEPAIVIKIKVKIDDSAVSFTKLRARRGWGAHFIVTNTGTKPHQLDIGGLRTRVLKPGEKGRVSASFENRGSFPFTIIGTRTAKQKGWFVVY